VLEKTIGIYDLSYPKKTILILKWQKQPMDFIGPEPRKRK